MSVLVSSVTSGNASDFKTEGEDHQQREAVSRILGSAANHTRESRDPYKLQ